MKTATPINPISPNNPISPSRTFHGLRAARIDDVENKGGFTYLWTTVNGVDVYCYEWPNSDEHTYFLMARDWFVFACTCKDFEFRHLPCKHCDTLQTQLWASELLKRRRRRDLIRRMEATLRGCWVESPLGSGCHVWGSELGLRERELLDLLRLCGIDIFDLESSDSSFGLIGNLNIDNLKIENVKEQKTKAQERGNASGLNIERKFRHAIAQYTS